jgi:hypothetical protein
MTDFHRTHAALFDELERQGVQCVDVGRLTRAVLEAKDAISTCATSTFNPRCVNGACDE